MRGTHQRDSVTHLQDIVRHHAIHFLFISYPKAAHHELSSAFSIGFFSMIGISLLPVRKNLKHVRKNL